MKKIFFIQLFLLIINGLIIAQRQNYSQVQQANNEFEKFNAAFSYINMYYVEAINNSELVEEAIKAMLLKLDPHSTYTNAEETRKMNEPLESNFDGIGIQFDMLLDTLYITQVIAGGPSERVGLLPGDRIIMVNDTLIAGVHMTNPDVIKLIRGKKGTQVRIKVKRTPSTGMVDKSTGLPSLLEFLIIRDRIPIYSIDASYMADSTTGYIRLSRFAASTINEFKSAISELQQKGMKNLILDLQENGGGLLHISYVLANQFLAENKLIVYTQGDRIKRSNAYSSEGGLFKEGKLVVLINEWSASASEIVAGAIQDWDRGVIVGRRSFGKGLVQRSLELPDSSMIRLTIARYYTPSGRNIQKPYEKGNAEAYRHDIADRYKKGELTSAESINFPDSLKFKTLVFERIVYGGGGIMPDLFIPIDTNRISDYHTKLRRANLINLISMSYVDKNRKELNNKYPNIDIFNASFFVKENLLQELKKLADEKLIEFDEVQFDNSKEFIMLDLKAHIAGDLFNISAYYQIINEWNDSYRKALQVINDDKQYYKILTGK